MATINPVIRKSKINAKGECLIFLRYLHKKQSTDISTGIKTKPDYWNDKRKEINSTKGINKSKANEELIRTLAKSDKEKNHKIKILSEKIMSIVRDIEREEEIPYPQIVKGRYSENKNGKEKRASLLDEPLTPMIEDFIRLSNKSTGTKQNYNTALYHLKEFQSYQNKKLKIRDISFKLYEELSYFLLNELSHNQIKDKKGISDNSVGTTIKNIKVFAQYLIQKGYEINTDLSQFKVVERVKPIIFLTEEEVIQLYNHDFSKSQRLEKARDLFVFNCYIGLRFSDLSRLRKSHIINSAIDLRALKNQKDVFVYLAPIAREIFEKYNYQLPTISEQKLNKYIKEVCQKAEINSEIEIINISSGNKEYAYVPKYSQITSHIAIKTFITMCGDKGISPKSVSEITGKSVNIIMKHYYGIDKISLRSEMERAFG